MNALLNITYIERRNTGSRPVKFSGIAADEARFWAKVEKTPTCWLWTGGRLGGKGARNYGQFTTTPSPGTQQRHYAHRWIYALRLGAEIPDGLSVLHQCDEPRCVNPDHLFLGTHLDNMRDAADKGRLNVPRPTGRKVSDADIAEMFSLRASGLTMASIAARFSVGKAFVSLVLNGKRRTA